MQNMFKIFKGFFEQSTYDIYKLLNEENVEYIFRGTIDEKITAGILGLAEVSLEEQADNTKLSKKIYYILIEGLQNITRHQNASPTKSFNEGLVVIQKRGNDYIITTGNTCLKDDIKKIKESLNKVNNLSHEELNEYYRQILSNNTFTQRGGAGLGLIEIARKSGNKIAYDFQKISNDIYYFYMQTNISPQKKDLDECYKSLFKIKNIHKYFIDNDIVFNLSGILTHTKLVYLVSLFESYFGNQIRVRNKFFSILIELLQNVEKYAEDLEINNIKGKHSVLFITSKDEELGLIVGNFISNPKLKQFQEYIDRLNAFSVEELYKLRSEVLTRFKQNSHISINGLGLVDIRIRTKMPIFFETIKVNEINSFIALILTIFSVKQNLNDALEILPTGSTPNIILDLNKNIFQISGNSFPENATNFYEQVYKWFKENQNKLPDNSHIDFRFYFINSTSRKELIKIFNLFEKIFQIKKFVINFFVTSENEDMKEFVKDLILLFPELDIRQIIN